MAQFGIGKYLSRIIIEFKRVRSALKLGISITSRDMGGHNRWEGDGYDLHQVYYKTWFCELCIFLLIYQFRFCYVNDVPLKKESSC